MLFDNRELAERALWAKEERIDKQYSIENRQFFKVTRESCDEMIVLAEDFLLKIKVLISRLNNDKIMQIRKLFKELLCA